MYASAFPAVNRSGLALVVALHAIVFWGLVQMKLVVLPAPLAVLSVSLLPAAEVIPPRPEIVPPKPKLVARRPQPVAQPTQLAAPAELPAPTPIAVAPAPTIVAAPAPVAPAPAPVATQPRFDADYLDNPKPVYPAISRRLGEQGRVVLRVHVEADGRAAEVQLHTSSGSPRLDQSALDTVRRWKFVPARLGREPTAAWVLVPIAFTLKD
ncbi:MAG: energy transducer TonB [Sulfuritalea sp.]|nr:energy transducer TonB [Sulfuritalea sp.]MDP1981134.1 energy transducer TonB [Sulfuritalea sp.]